MNLGRGVIFLILSVSFCRSFSGEEYTPVSHQSFYSQEEVNQGTPWVPTAYSQQKNIIGYNKKTFHVSDELKTQVEFWKDIYTKYSSTQGVLHDSEKIDLIYEVIDFHAIESNKNINKYEKEKFKERAIRSKKRYYRQVLRKLQKRKKNEKLTPLERRIKKAFSGDMRKNKYYLASLKGRLRFQLGQRDYFLRGIYYFGRYKKQIEEIFSQYNLPLELTRLPLVESSYNILARSRVGASGIWQIMPRTGKQYIKVNRIVDERNHPIISSEVAAKILRKNYKLLQSWPLAITGYNHGAYGIRKLVRKYGIRDLVKLINKGKKKRFGFASKNFYATFLAALEVERNAKKYFTKVYYAKPLKDKKIKLHRSISYKKLLSWFDGDIKAARLFNPHISQSRKRRKKSLIHWKTSVYVPVAKYKRVSRELKKRTLSKKSRRRVKRHKVSKGESLSLIARRYGLSVKRILLFNSMRKPDYIKVGQVLLIPSH